MDFFFYFFAAIKNQNHVCSPPFSRKSRNLVLEVNKLGCAAQVVKKRDFTHFFTILPAEVKVIHNVMNACCWKYLKTLMNH
jgi:hypothetical protein